MERFCELKQKEVINVSKTQCLQGIVVKTA